MTKTKLEGLTCRNSQLIEHQLLFSNKTTSKDIKLIAYWRCGASIGYYFAREASHFGATLRRVRELAQSAVASVVDAAMQLPVEGHDFRVAAPQRPRLGAASDSEHEQRIRVLGRMWPVAGKIRL